MSPQSPENIEQNRSPESLKNEARTREQVHSENAKRLAALREKEIKNIEAQFDGGIGGRKRFPSFTKEQLDAFIRNEPLWAKIKERLFKAGPGEIGSKDRPSILKDINDAHEKLNIEMSKQADIIRGQKGDKGADDYVALRYGELSQQYAREVNARLGEELKPILKDAGLDDKQIEELLLESPFSLGRPNIFVDITRTMIPKTPEKK